MLFRYLTCRCLCVLRGTCLRSSARRELNFDPRHAVAPSVLFQHGALHSAHAPRPQPGAKPLQYRAGLANPRDLAHAAAKFICLFCARGLSAVAYASATARRAPMVKRRELIDRIAAGAPVRKLFFVEALGDTRAPLPGAGRITAPGSS